MTGPLRVSLVCLLLCAASGARAGLFDKLGGGGRGGGIGNGAVIGAVVGGVSSVVHGGSFGEGARAGAAAASASGGTSGDVKTAWGAGKSAASQGRDPGPSSPFPPGHGGEHRPPAAGPAAAASATANPAASAMGGVPDVPAAAAAVQAAPGNSGHSEGNSGKGDKGHKGEGHKGKGHEDGGDEAAEGEVEGAPQDAPAGPAFIGGTSRPAPPSRLASLDSPKRYQVHVPELPPGREYKGGASAAADLSAHQRLGMSAVASANGAMVDVGVLAPPSVGHPAGARRLASGARVDGSDGERALRATLSSGESRFGLKDYKGALAEAQAAISMAPGRADGYLLYAKVLNRMGLHAKAEEMARKARERSSDLGAATRAQFELTQAYLFQGRTADAIASAAQAIALAQKSGNKGLEANAHYLQAAACQLKGDRECMVKSLERAALLDGKYYAALEAARSGRNIFDPKDAESLGLLDAVGTDAVPAPGELGAVGAVLLGAFALMAGAAAWVWRRSRRAAPRPTIAEAFGKRDDGRMNRPSAASGAMEAADGLLGGKYELGRSVPSGGRGEMWEARDLSLGRACHVLRLPSPEAAARARQLALAHHPAVVDVFEVLESPRGTFLVMEHLRGRTLRQILAAQGPLELAEARRLLKPACEALEFARGQGVADGSLDLSRVLMTDDGYVKVLDLGAARPESAGRTDVQALAACLEELVTGEPPRPGRPALGGPVGELLREAAAGGVPGPAAFAARLDRLDLVVPAG